MSGPLHQRANHMNDPFIGTVDETDLYFSVSGDPDIKDAILFVPSPTFGWRKVTVGQLRAYAARTTQSTERQNFWCRVLAMVAMRGYT